MVLDKGSNCFRRHFPWKENLSKQIQSVMSMLLFLWTEIIFFLGIWSLIYKSHYGKASWVIGELRDCMLEECDVTLAMNCSWGMILCILKPIWENPLAYKQSLSLSSKNTYMVCRALGGYAKKYADFDCQT